MARRRPQPEQQPSPPARLTDSPPTFGDLDIYGGSLPRPHPLTARSGGEGWGQRLRYTAVYVVATAGAVMVWLMPPPSDQDWKL